MRRPLSSSAWLRLATAAAAAALVVLAVAAPVGAAGPPTLVKDINPGGSSNPTELTQVGNTLFFAADDGIHGVELWKTDGTAAGTKMVKNIRPLGKSSFPGNLVNVKGTLFFMANDGTHGYELWKSNGTAAGTKMVKDLNTGKPGSYGGSDTYIHERLVAIGARVFFATDECCIGNNGIYVSDGTAAGTRRLDSDVEYFEGMPETGGVGTAGGKFYFVANVSGESDLGSQLWVSDGTDAGTHRVAGSPASGDWEVEMSILPVNGQKLYFHDGTRLWRTNGTAAGTKPLTSIGELPSAPSESALLGARLYFNDDALWRTDGTAAGTVPISTGAPSWLTVAGSALYFTRGSHLWRSNGTAAGTTDLGQFGAYGARQLIGVGTELCFVALNDPTWALWESDGTALGTYQVRSFVGAPGEVQQAAIGGKLFFAADDGVHGAELWSYTP